ncbi:MAG: Gfo/Idh/MocA family oxidoreductase [Acidobacteria bacterium]|nr:Gfo/Idh/MocA family oxidoreductase [Acidobacteriota bacterium]MBI3278266.1 Gfo/Idh/MocA family oxidoreductase [Acidobacteriota bacterium]
MASRRVFLLQATAASAARVLGANDRIRLGVIGTGGRGTHLIRMANQAGGIEWAALCDAWDERRAKARNLIDRPVDLYADYRKLLDRKDVDGVIIATLDHLHTPIAVDACRAGKDVFVEKPMTSTPMQGRDLVRAVRETRRVLQVGVQQRSLAHFIEAKQRFFDSGLIGKVEMVRTLWNGNRGYLSPVPAGMERKPDGLDWEAVLGWLPKIAWDPKRYFNRFAYWDFATGGQTGGLFVHMVDVVHWFLGLRRPVSAVGLGGIYRHDDGRDTPDNVNLILDYPEKLNVTFEATLTSGEAADIVFMGSGGRLSIFRSGYRFLPRDSKAEVTAGPSAEVAHMANWLECMRTRREPNANVVDGHYSAMACHIGNLAYRENNRVTWRSGWDV